MTTAALNRAELEHAARLAAPQLPPPLLLPALVLAVVRTLPLRLGPLSVRVLLALQAAVLATVTCQATAQGQLQGQTNMVMDMVVTLLVGQAGTLVAAVVVATMTAMPGRAEEEEGMVIFEPAAAHQQVRAGTIPRGLGQRLAAGAANSSTMMMTAEATLVVAIAMLKAAPAVQAAAAERLPLRRAEAGEAEGEGTIQTMLTFPEALHGRVLTAVSAQAAAVMGREGGLTALLVWLAC